MNKKEIEIAAISASIAAGCLPCLKFHKGIGIEMGINEDELFEISNLALKIRANADKHGRSKIDEILCDNFEGEIPAQIKSNPSTDCNC